MSTKSDVQKNNKLLRREKTVAELNDLFRRRKATLVARVAELSQALVHLNGILTDEDLNTRGKFGAEHSWLIRAELEQLPRQFGSVMAAMAMVFIDISWVEDIQHRKVKDVSDASIVYGTQR